MAANDKGTQRPVYFSNEEWKEHDKIGEERGLPGKTKFLVYLFRQYIRGNLVFKRKK